MAVFDLRTFLNEISEIVCMQLKLTHLSYSSYIDDSVPSVVYTDARRLRQVLLTLLGNAIKYNVENGSIRLRVAKVDEHLRISVIDTGKGVTREKAGSLFKLETACEPYKSDRVSVSLPVSNAICRLLGGDLQVDSEGGRGSTFTFLLRLNPLPPDSPFLLQHPRAPPPPQQPQRTQDAEGDVPPECLLSPFPQIPLRFEETRKLSSCSILRDTKEAKGEHLSPNRALNATFNDNNEANELADDIESIKSNEPKSDRSIGQRARSQLPSSFCKLAATSMVQMPCFGKPSCPGTCPCSDPSSHR
jgi:hypothetical protein